MRMSKAFAVLFIAAWGLVLPQGSIAQQDDVQRVDTTTSIASSSEPMRLRLRDGSEVVGIIEEETDDVLRFRTLSGVVMEVPRDQVKSMQRLEGRIVNGEVLRVDPNHTRLLFAPTARPLGNGRGYLAVYEIFFPFVAYGAGSAVSLSGGVSLIPTAAGQLVYAAPKVTVYQQQNRAVAVGGLASTFVGDDEGGTAGILFGAGTLGGPERSVTVGAGWGFVDDELADRPLLLLGGDVQLSNHVKLLSENYLLPGIDDAIILSGGVRFFGDQLAADLAFFTVPAAWDEGGFPFFPWLGFAYNFGR